LVIVSAWKRTTRREATRPLTEAAYIAIVYLEALEGMRDEYVDHMEKLERQVMRLLRESE
jgi:hypothetical protein